MALEGRLRLVGSTGDGHEGGLRDQLTLVRAGLTLYEYQLYAVEQWCASNAYMSHHADHSETFYCLFIAFFD